MNVFEKLYSEIYNKIQKTNFIKTPKINDYEITAEIKIYLKNKIIPIIVDLDLKRENPFPEYLIREIKINEIEEVEYSIKVVLQKFFIVKSFLNLFKLHLLQDNQIIKMFEKYKKVFIAIESDLIKLNKEINGNIRFFVNEYDSNCEEHYINYKISPEKPLKISKYLKGSFLMKELEKIYGRYFFIKTYEIWGEICLKV